jgi:hypothetical protein
MASGLATARTQEQLGAQQALGNVLGQRDQLNQQAYLTTLAAQLGLSEAQLRAMLGNQQFEQGMAQVPTGAQKMLGTASGIASLGAMLSDERTKTDVAPAGKQVDAMMDSLRPYSYRYKQERHGTGHRAGIMAQDLERSEAGRRVIQETPDGKGLDRDKALSAALAMSARLNERLRKLEG